MHATQMAAPAHSTHHNQPYDVSHRRCMSRASMSMAVMLSRARGMITSALVMDGAMNCRYPVRTNRSHATRTDSTVRPRSTMSRRRLRGRSTKRQVRECANVPRPRYSTSASTHRRARHTSRSSDVKMVTSHCRRTRSAHSTKIPSTMMTVVAAPETWVVFSVRRWCTKS